MLVDQYIYEAIAFCLFFGSCKVKIMNGYVDFFLEGIL